MLRDGAKNARELWSVGLDGSNPKRLSVEGERVSELVLSPDGERMFYVKEVVSGSGGVGYDVFSMRLDGEESPKRVTTEELYVSDLSMSPDGRELLFLLKTGGYPARGKGRICVVPVTGGEVSTIGTNY